MYPKTKYEAVKVLREKVEKALKNHRYAGVVGGYTKDCPLCQWSAREGSPSAWDVDCDRCRRAFRKKLGYDDRMLGPCAGASFGGLESGDYWDATSRQRRAFLEALLPVLKEMEAKYAVRK